MIFLGLFMGVAGFLAALALLIENEIAQIEARHCAHD